MHDMEQIKATWNTIKKRLIEESGFEDFLRGKVNFCDWRYHQCKHLPEGVWGAAGATRMVFGLDSDQTVVFKMLKDRDDINYNESEVFIYQRAVEAGLSQWFAWTTKVDTINYDGVITEIYAMEYCDVDGDQLENASYELAVQEYLADEGLTLEEMSNDDRENMYDMIDSSECGDSDGIQHYMFAIYDIDDMDALYSFIDDYNINDTHAGNWGYLNNHLVLVDYGGYERNVIEMAKECA